MKLTAREVIGRLVQANINLAGIERVLELPQRSLRPLFEAEGPAPAETEILLNMIIKYPWLLTVAQENFNLKNLVVEFFGEWKESQKQILEALAM